MNTPQRLIVILLSSSITLVACNGRESSPASAANAGTLSSALAIPDEGAVVARVDGIPIHEAWLTTIARGRNLDVDDPEQRARAIDELVEYAVLVNAARTGPEFAGRDARAEIELNALAARANSIMARVGAASEPDEAAMRAEYDTQLQLNGDREYDVSHLLFADEATAIDAAGAALSRAFAEVQGEYKDRARQAVDLGWIKLGQVPPEFAATLRGLAAGETTPVPVQTSYGWHVIHLRADRPFNSPPFEQVREGIRRMLMAKATRDAVDALKADSRIEIVTAR